MLQEQCGRLAFLPVCLAVCTYMDEYVCDVPAIIGSNVICSFVRTDGRTDGADMRAVQAEWKRLTRTDVRIKSGGHGTEEQILDGTYVWNYLHFN